MEPTDDTPQERDDKAAALEDQRKELAKVVGEAVANQIYQLRWEMRVMYATAIIIATLALLLK